MKLDSRRLFLGRAATAFSLLLFNPFAKILAGRNQNALPSWRELVDYARWCPTVHNLQPHLVKVISETEADLYYNPVRLLPIGDPHAIFVTVAMGIFHEHLSIAASPYGKKIEMTEVFNPMKIGGKEPVLFAKLRMAPADEKDPLDRALILKRRTSRLHYDCNPIRQEILVKVKSGATRFGHEFFSSSERELVDYVIQLNQETLFEDIGSKPDCEELDHLFRYTEQDAKTKKDGLWAKCMGFSGSLMKSVFQNPDKWHKGLKKKLLANHYKKSFKGTATIGWFGGKFDNTTDWLEAGRMLTRNWLLMTQEGAYIQPFGSLITNPEAYKKINAKFTQPGTGKKIWMIFRAGYSREPARSFRLSTGEIFLS